MENVAQHAPTLAMLVMAAVAAYTDFKTGLIPNRVVLFGALLGGMARLLVVASAGSSPLVLAYTLLGGIVLCSIVPGVLYALGGMGGGDLKLFAAIGLCMGPLVGMDIQLVSYVVALLLVPLYLAREGRLRATVRQSATVLQNMWLPVARRTPVAREQMTSVRFAPAIFAAALLVTAMQTTLGKSTP